MNIGGCASLETRDGRLVTVRINLIGLVGRLQNLRDLIRLQHRGDVVVLPVHMDPVEPVGLQSQVDLK
jgi:hypothetical protein